MSTGKEVLQLFFREALLEASSQMHLKIEQWTEFYLVNLLVQYAYEPGDLSTPVIFQLEKALASPNPNERFVRLRNTGDAALFLRGFLAAHIAHRGISKDYVVVLGGRAYRGAAPLSADGMTHVYHRLADGFDEYIALLDEVRELTSLRTQQDIVRLYDRWSKTGAASALRRLKEAGVFPVRGGSQEH